MSGFFRTTRSPSSRNFFPATPTRSRRRRRRRSSRRCSTGWSSPCRQISSTIFRPLTRGGCKRCPVSKSFCKFRHFSFIMSHHVPTNLTQVFKESHSKHLEFLAFMSSKLSGFNEKSSAGNWFRTLDLLITRLKLC